MRSYPWVVVRLRRLPLSCQIDRRVPPVLLLMILAMSGAMVINIGVGEYPIAPLDVVGVILRMPTANPDHDFIVNTLRLPRVLVAALVGLSLGVAGTILQGLTHNSLADPGIVGISAGAGLAAVTLIVAIPGVSIALLPPAAFAGALIVALLIYTLAWQRGDAPLRLILIGIGLGAVASAATTLMMTFGDIYDVRRALIWLSGSVYGRSWEEYWALLPWVALFVPLALLLARDLNLLNLGEDVARSLGCHVIRRRALLLCTAVGLAAVAVAAAGPIGFVGLMAPHTARRLVGPRHEGLLPAAGLFGAFIVVAADLIGRTLFAPIELPCGLITAAVGAPFFVFLLWCRRFA